MNEQPEIIEALTDYYAAFSTLDAQAFLPFFHEPTLLIAPEGIIAATTHAVLAAAFAPTLENLRAQGFARSDLNVRQIKTLSATAGLLTGVAIRYKRDGQEMERVGVTYVLHKKDAAWKIAVLILHDVDENEAGAS